MSAVLGLGDGKAEQACDGKLFIHEGTADRLDITLHEVLSDSDHTMDEDAARLEKDGALAPLLNPVAGLRVDSYADGVASLRLLIEAPGRDGGVDRAAAVVQVVWSDGDWRLVAPPRGDWSTVRAPVHPGQVQAYPRLPGR